jgi:aspartate/methionine/tyrosine aminotransferase
LENWVLGIGQVDCKGLQQAAGSANLRGMLNRTKSSHSSIQLRWFHSKGDAIAFKRRRDFMVDAFSKIKGFRLNMPGGAFYIYPEIAYFSASSKCTNH